MSSNRIQSILAVYLVHMKAKILSRLNNDEQMVPGTGTNLPNRLYFRYQFGTDF
ncbi:hypothetical protein Hanom_Chr13g01190111 [Helianthus anomalus]